jgi:hypothetical protein
MDRTIQELKKIENIVENRMITIPAGIIAIISELLFSFTV